MKMSAREERRLKFRLPDNPGLLPRCRLFFMTSPIVRWRLFRFDKLLRTHVCIGIGNCSLVLRTKRRRSPDRRTANSNCIFFRLLCRLASIRIGEDSRSGRCRCAVAALKGRSRRATSHQIENWPNGFERSGAELNDCWETNTEQRGEQKKTRKNERKNREQSHVKLFTVAAGSLL